MKLWRLEEFLDEADREWTGVYWFDGLGWKLGPVAPTKMHEMRPYHILLQWMKVG